jgi:hypothetical protein
VLVTDRRLGVQASESPPVSSAEVESDFTLIEMVIDGNGVGEGKTSLRTGVVVDATAKTLALDDYAAAPVLLKVTR